MNEEYTKIVCLDFEMEHSQLGISEILGCAISIMDENSNVLVKEQLDYSQNFEDQLSMFVSKWCSKEICLGIMTQIDKDILSLHYPKIFKFFNCIIDVSSMLKSKYK
jgi:oligoribonuclease (3'-5' exoribonuclease)